MNVLELHKLLQDDKTLSDDERLDLMAILDPIVWSESTLSNPNQAGKPLVLREHQKEMISYQPMSEIVNDIEVLKQRIKVYRTGRRCLTGDMPVLMSNGVLKKISEIKVGDEVVSRNSLNRPVSRKVSAVYENGIQPIYLIKLSDGRSIECTKNHPLFVYIKTKNGNRNNYTLEWRSIEDGLPKGTKAVVLKNYTIFGSYHDTEEAALLGYL